MDRRQFLQASASAAAISATGCRLASREKAATIVADPASVEPWYRRAYRRNVIDMHITDDDPSFLSQFDPKTYATLLRDAQVQSAVTYAHSHVGLCYFPTNLGRMHRGVEGKNHLARLIEELHKSEIAVVLYMSLIFDRWAYVNHPDWKIRRPDGQPASEESRHGLCCPNSPYRDYAAGLIREICSQFEFEGLRCDMTFWPRVCYCPHCAARFDREVGGALPTAINWTDPRWVAFQRKREEWLLDFASLMTRTAKELKPGVTVEHQSSTLASTWRMGVTEKLAERCDFLQGDFYGDALQGSFIRKLLRNLSPNLPYGFETSVMVNLQNHTAIKSEDLLRTKAHACVADGGAFVFIDAIDPAGTLNPRVYETMGRVFERTKIYEPELGGEQIQDVAVYLSTESKFDFAQNGRNVEDYGAEGMPHIDAALGACKALIDHHIPYGVITRKNLGELSRFKVVVLPNVLMMDAEEIAAISGFVRRGGALYASGETSRVDKDGNRHADFMMAEILGVSHAGQTDENYTFIAPAAGSADGAELLRPYTLKSPLAVDGPQLIVKAREGACVLGKIVLPFTNPGDWKHYASIHSNPPGKPTEHPAIVLNQFGKGRAGYAAFDLERQELHHPAFVRLLHLLKSKYSIESTAPSCVEHTLFDQKDRGRYLINSINFQKELPSLPVENISVRVQMRGRNPKRLMVLPDGPRIPFKREGDTIRFTILRLETFLMLGLTYD